MVETGFFYSTVLDPLLKSSRIQLAGHIKANDKVIDIACGTGAQVFEIAKKAKYVVGVDFSKSMIRFASQRLKKRSDNNIAFLLEDASNLSSFSNNEFDVATMSLALHQFDKKLYSLILNEMKRIANSIILLDYAVPLPKNIVGYGSKIAEFLAGREHNKNFMAYCKSGGLQGILKQNKLNPEYLGQFGSSAFQLIHCDI